jgi:hypothetical protein
MAKGITTFRGAMHDVMSPFGRTLSRRSVLSGAFACYRDNRKKEDRFIGRNEWRNYVPESKPQKLRPPELPAEFQEMMHATEDISKIEVIAQNCIDRKYFGVAKECYARALKLLSLQPKQEIEVKARLLEKLISALKAVKEDTSVEQKKIELDKQIESALKELKPIKEAIHAKNEAIRKGIEDQIKAVSLYEYSPVVVDRMREIENTIFTEGADSVFYMCPMKYGDKSVGLVRIIDNDLEYDTLHEIFAGVRDCVARQEITQNAKVALKQMGLLDADKFNNETHKESLIVEYSAERPNGTVQRHFYFKSFFEKYKAVTTTIKGPDGSLRTVLLDIKKIEYKENVPTKLKGTFHENMLKAEELLFYGKRNDAEDVVGRIENAKMLRGEEIGAQNWVSYKFTAVVSAVIERYGYYKDIIYSRFICPDNCLAVKFGNKVYFYFAYKADWYKVELDTGSERIFGLWKLTPGYFSHKKK